MPSTIVQHRENTQLLAGFNAFRRIMVRIFLRYGYSDSFIAPQLISDGGMGTQQLLSRVEGNSVISSRYFVGARFSLETGGGNHY